MLVLKIRGVLHSLHRVESGRAKRAISIVGVSSARMEVQGTGGSSRTAGTLNRRSHVSHLQTLSRLVLLSTLRVPGQAQPCREGYQARHCGRAWVCSRVAFTSQRATRPQAVGSSNGWDGGRSYGYVTTAPRRGSTTGRGATRPSS